MKEHFMCSWILLNYLTFCFKREFMPTSRLNKYMLRFTTHCTTLASLPITESNRCYTVTVQAKYYEKHI